ncbi:MAG: RDD family protein [Arenicella sp.]|nr:RDD family protein [Arenicella sp.]
MNDDRPNPYATPQANLDNGIAGSHDYAGFWVRAVASIVDTIVILIITGPFMFWIYGTEMFTSTDMVKGPADVLLSYIFPLAFTIVLWMKFGGTPGKRLLKIKVLDEKTGQHLSLAKALLRYVGYFVSILGLFIGFIWIAFDSKKKGWHDHIAGSIVVIG